MDENNKTVRVDNPEINMPNEIPTFNAAQFQTNNPIQFNQPQMNQPQTNQPQMNQQAGFNQMQYNQPVNGMSMNGMQMNGMPMNNGGEIYPSDLQMSLQNKSNDAPKKSKTPMIVGVSVGLVALLVGGIALILHKPDKKKDTTEQVTTTEVASTATDAATTEAIEPATTEVAQQPQVPGYEAPTTLGTSWKDYNFKLGDTIYQLPIPYTVFQQFGWNIQNPPETVSAGNFEYVSAIANDGTELCIIIGNANVSAAPLQECYILGIDIDTKYDKLNSELTLAGDITVNKSTITDVKAAYGTPDDYYAYDDGSEVTYVGENYDDGLDMDFDKDGVLISVKYLRAEVKNALNQNAANVSSEVPALNAQYVKPSGPSQAENDAILDIDGAYYKLPVPLSEFLANGWELDIMSDEVIYGDNKINTYITKGNSKLDVTITNYTSDAILTVNGIVSNIYVYDYFIDGMDITFPGNLKIGGTADEAKAVLSKYGEDYYESEVGEFAAYSAYMMIDEETYLEYKESVDTENGVIDTLYYGILGFKSY